MIGQLSFSLFRFPDFILDKDYCYELLNTALSDCECEELNYNKFSDVFEDLANPSGIKYTDLSQYVKRS